MTLNNNNWVLIKKTQHFKLFEGRKSISACNKLSQLYVNPAEFI
jgi:hypothetical protein